MIKLAANTYSIVFFGALTNKPHAFKFRAWELETTKNFNFFDVLVEDILIETRGSNILRILPLSFEFPEYNWLTDRSRFFFDSLKNQRVLEPFFFYKQNLKIQWSLVLSFINYTLLKIKQNKMFLFSSKMIKQDKQNYGKFSCVVSHNFNTDLKDSLAFIDLKQKLGGALDVQNNFVENAKQLPFLVSSLKPFAVNVSSFFLLVNLDLRFEIPKLNLFLRQQQKAKVFKIFTVGVRCLGVSKFNFKNLGLSFSTLLRIVEGRHWFNNLILKNKNTTYFCLGQGAHKNIACGNFLETLNVFSTLYNVKVLKFFVDVNSLNVAVLNQRVNLVLFKQQRLENLLLNKTVLLFNMSVLNSNSFFYKKNILAVQLLSFKENFFTDKKNINITLPVATFFEREQHTYDLLGKIKKNSKVLEAPATKKNINKQKTVYAIFNVLSALVSLEKKKKKLLDMFFSKEQKLKPFLGFIQKTKAFVFFYNSLIFANFVCDLYKQDEFSKNSLVLSIAGNVFYNTVSNY